MINPPAWVARKAAHDAMDDGQGPYMEWIMRDDAAAAIRRAAWDDFKRWATDHFGQGYSLACFEGSCVENLTGWAFTAYLAGRGL